MAKSSERGSATFECKASGLKWLVKLKLLTDNRTAYFGLTWMSWKCGNPARRSWEPMLVGNSDVGFGRVGHEVRESIAILDHGSDSEFPRQLHYAPRQKAIGQIGREVAELVARMMGMGKVPK